MSKKMNEIIEAWDRSCSREQEVFLRELHKRYGFERLSQTLSILDYCEGRNKDWYRENEQRFQLLLNKPLT